MMTKRRLIVLLVILFLAGCAGGNRGCRPTDPPPTVTPTIPPPPATWTRTPVPITVTATMTPEPPTLTPGASNTPTATIQPSVTPTSQPSATATPELLGHHTVVYGDTMYEIGLAWYAGRFFAWGREVWEPICAANPEIADCRMIFPGDVLRVPRLP